VKRKQHLCEICTAPGAMPFTARCKHTTWLCPTCHKQCTIAMERCEACDRRATKRAGKKLEFNDG